MTNDERIKQLFAEAIHLHANLDDLSHLLMEVWHELDPDHYEAPLKGQEGFEEMVFRTEEIEE